MEERIGSYKVLKKIGAGGMAKVYLAVHKDVPSLKVILKILGDDRMADRFRQEADKLALLDGHPNICQIKHFFSHGDDTVIAMEYIDGVTLEDRIAEVGKLPVDEALRIACETLEVLDFAHAKGIFHRDIKPGNIMIDRSGKVRIIDFGIAKGENDPNLTVAGTACGTPAYMAPEQFNPEADTDYAMVDLYAVGTTLHVMLTGELPFEGDNAFALRDLKLFSNPPGIRASDPSLPRNLELVILDSMCKDPTGRFESAAQMRQALLALMPQGPQKDKATAPKDIDATASMDSGATPTASGRKTVIFGGIVVVVIVVAVVLWQLLGREERAADDSVPIEDSAAIEEITQPLEPPEGSLELTANLAADFYVDGNLIASGETQASFEGDTGRHVIEVRRLGAVVPTQYDTVIVAADDEVSRTYRFEMPQKPVAVSNQPVKEPPVQEETRPPAEAQVTTATLRIGTIPGGALVYIDGELQSNPAPFQYKVSPGSHDIRVVLDWEGEELTDEMAVDVQAGSTYKVSFDLLDKTSASELIE